jgi:hypothetical protein
MKSGGTHEIVSAHTVLLPSTVTVMVAVCPEAAVDADVTRNSPFPAESVSGAPAGATVATEGSLLVTVKSRPTVFPVAVTTRNCSFELLPAPGPSWIVGAADGGIDSIESIGTSAMVIVEVPMTA